MNSKTLTIKSAALQALYWAVFATTNSFAIVNLLARGFTNTQVGLLLAIAGTVSAFAQPVIGTLTDKIEKATVKLVLCLLSISGLALLALFMVIPDNLLLVGLVYGAIAAITASIQPFVNALIFEYINQGVSISFGATRGAGSITFAGATSLAGLLLNLYSAKVMPIFSMVLYLLFLLVVMSFPKINHEQIEREHSDKNESFFTFVKKYHRFFYFLLGIIATFTFHTMLFTYLLQIMLHVGGTDSDFGLSLTISALSELPIMLGFSFLAARIKVSKLMKIGAAVYLLRAVLLLLATSVLMVNAIQLLQALSFAVLIPASVYYVNTRMDEGDKVKGQTFVVGANTVGSVIGALLGGFLLDNFSVTTMLQVGVVCALIGVLLFVYSVVDKEKAI